MKSVYRHTTYYVYHTSMEDKLKALFGRYLQYVHVQIYIYIYIIIKYYKKIPKTYLLKKKKKKKNVTYSSYHLSRYSFCYVLFSFIQFYFILLHFFLLLY